MHLLTLKILLVHPPRTSSARVRPFNDKAIQLAIKQQVCNFADNETYRKPGESGTKTTAVLDVKLAPQLDGLLTTSSTPVPLFIS